MGLLDRLGLKRDAAQAAPTPSAPPAPVAPSPALAVSVPASRAAADIPLAELSFAVLDFETSGLSPDGNRVVEVACIRTRADGSVESELHSLIDPQGPVGPTAIHGIRQSDVAGAPTFADIADALLTHLDGAVLVAHNASFDKAFLLAELARAGVIAPPLPYVCTMRLRNQVDLPGPSAHKLTWACWQEGIPIETAHAAVCDARAAGGLLARYLEHAGECEIKQLADCRGSGKAVESWQQPLPRLAGRRGQVRLRQRSAQPCPTQLANRSDGSADGLAAYTSALAAAASDFHIDEAEIDVLSSLIASGGLSSRQVRDAHAAHLRAELDERLADGILTWAEEQEVRAFGRLLGVPDPNVEQLLAEAGASATIEGKPALTSPDAAAGAGLRVCFTGAFTAMPLSRQEVIELAEQAGMVVAKSVSGKTEIVVCQDPASGSGKLRKAAEVGTLVIDQATFLALPGVQPDSDGSARSVLEQVEARRVAAAGERERKRAATAARARERARQRPPRAQGATGGPPGVQELWCQAGQHEWSRPAQRGRPPLCCPEHSAD